MTSMTNNTITQPKRKPKATLEGNVAGGWTIIQICQAKEIK
jgi:hypothetical protein